MKNKKLALLWSASLVIGLTVGLILSSCVQAPIDARSILAQIEAMGQTNRVSSETIEYVDVEMMYEALSFEDMTDRASAIFVGKIVSISPTQWNQDSGEYWNNPEEGFEIPIHYIEVDVLKPIVDTVKLGTQVKIAVLSESPTIDEKGIVLDKEKPHDLALGQQVVLFIQQTDIAWRGGTRQVMILMGVPADSYFTLREDGLYHGNLIKEAISLEALIDRILEERKTTD